MRSWGVRQWWDVEGLGHQVLFSIHQVLQLLLSQEALEELAVIWTWQLHAIVTLSKSANLRKKHAAYLAILHLQRQSEADGGQKRKFKMSVICVSD